MVPTSKYYRFKVELGDDRMYWCEVSIKDGGEFKFDGASTVMRIHDTENQSLPKFHQVNTAKSLLQATEGEKITLDCRFVTYLLYFRPETVLFKLHLLIHDSLKYEQ